MFDGEITISDAPWAFVLDLNKCSGLSASNLGGFGGLGADHVWVVWAAAKVFPSEVHDTAGPDLCGAGNSIFTERSMDW